MLKVYRNVMVVVCMMAITGMFVGTAAADFLYDFDDNVGETLIANQTLTGQDGWEVRTGSTAYLDNIWVGSGASGWSGKYAINHSSVLGNTYMVRNSSFGLQDGRDFEMSAVISNNGSKTVMQTGLQGDYSYGYGNWMIFGVYSGNFCWTIREDDTINDFVDLIKIKPAMPDTSAKIWKVGYEVTAKGGNEYDIFPFYQDVTDPNNIGSKVYQYGTGGVPYNVTFSAPLSSMYDQIYMRMSCDNAGGNIMDDFTITQVPEPSTLVLLGCGLLGLLAYAWKKRK